MGLPESKRAIPIRPRAQQHYLIATWAKAWPLVTFLSACGTRKENVEGVCYAMSCCTRHLQQQHPLPHAKKKRHDWL